MWLVILFEVFSIFPPHFDKNLDFFLICLTPSFWWLTFSFHVGVITNVNGEEEKVLISLRNSRLPDVHRHVCLVSAFQEKTACRFSWSIFFFLFFFFYEALSIMPVNLFVHVYPIGSPFNLPMGDFKNFVQLHAIILSWFSFHFIYLTNTRQM